MGVGDGGAPELVAVGRRVGARNMGGANAREAKAPGIQGAATLQEIPRLCSVGWERTRWRITWRRGKLVWVVAFLA